VDKAGSAARAIESMPTAIVHALRALPKYPRLRVLDLSCGRGEVLAALQKDGCEVRGGSLARPGDPNGLSLSDRIARGSPYTRKIRSKARRVCGSSFDGYASQAMRYRLT
jgi:hypothetical protein